VVEIDLLGRGEHAHDLRGMRGHDDLRSPGASVSQQVRHQHALHGGVEARLGCVDEHDRSAAGAPQDFSEQKKDLLFPRRELADR